MGQTLGRYKLLERVGEGGCGLVYVAEQTEPVRRRVALKVIKLGMDTKQVVARFEAERQALAMMDHPNIAKVLDEYRLQNPKWWKGVRSGNGLAIWSIDWCETMTFSATSAPKTTNSSKLHDGNKHEGSIPFTRSNVHNNQ